MKNKYSKVERMLLFSITFSIVLLFIRIYFSESLMYLFYLWNFFLAVVPLLLSKMLLCENKLKLKSFILMACWLVFFPNAAYIITDILHFQERTPIPKWFDLLLVTSAAWNGIIISVVSLKQVEEFLYRFFIERYVKLFVFFSLMASAFGIYLGRFLRFNSWNVITNPVYLSKELFIRFISPLDHPRTWAFTFFIGTFLTIIYYTINQIQAMEKVNSNE